MISFNYAFQMITVAYFSLLPIETKSFASEGISLEAYRGHGIKFGLIPLVGSLQYILDHGILIGKQDGVEFGIIIYDVYEDVNLQEIELQKNGKEITIIFPNAHPLHVLIN